MTKKTIELNLTDKLYQTVKKYADYQQISVADYIMQLLNTEFGVAAPATFEERQFGQRKLSGRVIDEQLGLVLLDGINYRYQLDGTTKVDPKAEYRVVKIEGNQVYLTLEANQE